MPDDPNFFSAVMGALRQLTFESNWVQGTGVTAAAAAAAGEIMYEEALMSLGVCMTGQITAWSGATIPAGWLECDGTIHLRVDWPDLYSALDSVFIVDADHFMVPDLRGRSVVGVGSGSGLSPRAMNDAGGEESHVLIVSELASHTHTDAGHTHIEGTAAPAVGAAITGVPVPSAVPTAGVTGAGSASIQNTGADVAHNTMHPFSCLRFIIQAI